AVKRRRARAGVAGFEAGQGVGGLACVLGVGDLMHHDVRHLAIELIGRFRLSPEGRFPSVLLHYADLLPGADLRPLAFIAAGYILVRFLEAFGLWKETAWGEWLGALSGALYVPFRIR